MTCETCQGHRRIKQYIPLMNGWYETICPECNGCGQQSCCQGHEGQPEAEEE